MGRVGVKGFAAALIIAILAAGCAGAGDRKEAEGGAQTANAGTFPSAPSPALAPPPTASPSPAGLRCLYQSADMFAADRKVPPYTLESGKALTAGVVPHHLLAETLIAGFFRLAAQDAEANGAFDTVVIVAPNHDGDIADVVVSGKNWAYGGEAVSEKNLAYDGIVSGKNRAYSDGVLCDNDVIGSVLALRRKFNIAENDARVESDHSASAMVPFVSRYLPGAKVAPILVSRTMSLGDAYNFGESLADILGKQGKRVLLLCSIDFSHYLDPPRAFERDALTMTAISAKDYAAIHGFSNNHLDSPASLIVFLRYLEITGGELVTLDHTDASAFMGEGIPDTTTYLIMAGTQAE